jgi:hypothetical protein
MGTDDVGVPMKAISPVSAVQDGCLRTHEHADASGTSIASDAAETSTATIVGRMGAHCSGVRADCDGRFDVRHAAGVSGVWRARRDQNHNPKVIRGIIRAA